MLNKIEKLRGLNETGEITEKQLDELWKLEENNNFRIWRADFKKLK
jgi:hypothetical protein